MPGVTAPPLPPVCSASSQRRRFPWPARGCQYAIDDLTAGVTAAKLGFYGAAVLGLAALAGVFRFLQRRIIIGASRDIEFDLRNDFFAAFSCSSRPTSIATGRAT